jgi:hypothetical protein
MSRSRSTAAAPSSDTGGAGKAIRWLLTGGAIVGGAMFLRSLLRGTAPSNASRYAQFTAGQKFHEAAGFHRGRAAQTDWHGEQQQARQKKQQQQQQQQQRSQEAYWQQQQRQYEDEFRSRQQSRLDHNWDEAKSDFKRFSEFQERERERFGRSGSSGVSESDFSWNWREADPEFELLKEQARADYVQSKFAYRKRSKMIRRYQSWNPNRDPEDMDDDEAAARIGREFDEKYAAFRQLQKQIAYSPKHLAAREMLFGNFTVSQHGAGGNLHGIGGADASPTAPVSNSTPPPLSIESVKVAYRERAKLCHPDINGGDSEKFKQLTEAYELLLDTLETMAKSAPQTRPRGTSTNTAAQ